MKAKKLFSVILSLVMAVSVMSAFAVSASAADIKKLTSGKSYSYSFSKSGDTNTYKIVTNKAGTLKIKFTSQVQTLRAKVTDTNNKNLKPAKTSDSFGESGWNAFYGDTYMKWNTVENKYTGTLSYEVQKGTYYLELEAEYLGDKSVKFTPAFPSADSSSDVKITSFTIEMKKGETIQLKTLLSADTDDNVSWKSSKTSVAKVSATGKITAKAKGSATITASIGDSSMKIQVDVK